MRHKETEWIALGFIAVALIAIFSSFVANMVGLIQSLEKDKIGDAATWAGAVFAGLAFGGTIWIASQESRRRDREALAKARLCAPAIHMKLVGVIPLVEKAVEQLRTPQTPIDKLQGFLGRLFQNVPLWDVDDLEPLVCLPDSCAINLALTRELFIVTGKALSDEGKFSNVDETIKQLLSCLAHAKAASDTIIALFDSGN